MGNNAPRLVNAGVHRAIIRLTERQPDSRLIQQNAVATLSNLALHPRVGSELAAAGVHVTVLQILHRYPEYPHLTECAVTCLANIANSKSPDVLKRLIETRVHELCLRLVEVSSLKKVRRHAALCLNNLSVSKVTHTALLEANTPAVMARAMLLYPQQSLLLENALGVLARLSQELSSNGAEVTTVVLEAVLQTLRDYPYSHTLQTYGCVILLTYMPMLKPKAQAEQRHYFRQRRSEFNDAFAAACERGDEHVLSTYLRIIGMDPDRKQLFGCKPSEDGGRVMTPLQHAVEAGNFEVVSILMANNANKPPEADMVFMVANALKLGLESAELRFRQLLALAIITEVGGGNSIITGTDSKVVHGKGGSRTVAEINTEKAATAKTASAAAAATMTAITTTEIKEEDGALAESEAKKTKTAEDNEREKVEAALRAISPAKVSRMGGIIVHDKRSGTSPVSGILVMQRDLPGAPLHHIPSQPRISLWQNMYFVYLVVVLITMSLVAALLLLTP